MIQIDFQINVSLRLYSSDAHTLLWHLMCKTVFLGYSLCMFTFSELKEDGKGFKEPLESVP